jgi:hypothetical protein
LLWKAEGVVANSEKRPLPSAQWIPGPRTLLKDTSEITWELLINNILKSIADLNYSAKNNIKAMYLQQASLIVIAIRDMLSCSGTVSEESSVIKSNRSLAAYHQNLMTTLSKIILAAKVASGLWPPPDSVHSMRFQAGQVLLAVRHFVAVAQDLGIALRAIPPNDADEFDLRGTELSDLELVNRLDQNFEIITNSIAALVTKITRDRKISTTLIEQVKKTITDIGQFLSIIEDIQFDPSSDVENLVGDFKAKKESLYSCVNDLVTASSAGEDGYAPSNALGQMLESSTSVLEGVEEVLVASKLLIDRKEFMLEKSLYNESELNDAGSLAQLQKRAESLTFQDKTRSSGQSSSSLNNTNPVSPQPTTGARDSNSYSYSSRHTSVVSARRRSNDYPQPSPGDSGSASKLSQFFGEETVGQSARLSDVCLFLN